MSVLIGLSAALSSATVSFGIFDGDRAINWDIARLSTPAPHILLELFADPDGLGPDTPGTTAVLVQTWSGAALNFPNNAWLDLAAPNDLQAFAGDRYRYTLKVSAVDPANNKGWNSFKVRTTGTMALTPQSFAFLASLNAPALTTADAVIIYPSWPLLTPTTYDGAWQFAFSVPENAPDVTVWDGDMDYGDRACTYMDTNDPDSPAFPPFLHPSAVAEGVAVGNNVGFCPAGLAPTGDPHDDIARADFARKPTRLAPGAIAYEIVDPDGVSYVNRNPSGNREWEQFKITKAPDVDPGQLCLADNDPDRAITDCKAASLPEGIYLVNIDGMDMNNLNFWHFEYPVLGVTPTGTPVEEGAFYRLGRLVWYDGNRNGIPDPGEPGIAGVAISVVDHRGRVQSGVTTAGGEIFFRKPAGTYTVRVEASNLSGLLAGLTSTTGGEVRGGLTVGPPEYAEAIFGYAEPLPTASCVSITAVEGVAITPVTLTGSGGTGAPYTFTATGLPAGLTMSPSGTISGTPTVSGASGYTVTVTDKDGHSGTTSCSVTVKAPPSTSCVLITAVQGVAITPVTLTASGGTGAPYTFTATGLPAGLTMSSNGTISGTPTVNGTFSYTATVKDKDNNSRTTTCSITVAPPPAVGAFRTQTQGGWGSKPSGNNPGMLLAQNFSTVYPTGFVQIGGVKTLRFTSAAAVQAFLPQGGTAKALTESAVNPTAKLTVLAGQVLALQLSVDFSNAAVTRYGLGALQVKSGKLAGYTVGQVLALANAVLGGGAIPAGLSVSDVNGVVDAINNNFVDGTLNQGYLQ